MIRGEGIDKRYWVVATLWEAASGLGNNVGAQKWENQARALRVPAWMLETTESQIRSSQARLLEIAQLSAQ